MARSVTEHIVDGMQICRRCKINKPVEEFWKNRGKASGLCQYCKICSNLNRQETRIRIKTGTTKFSKGDYKNKGIEEKRKHTKNSFLKRKYDITLDDYNKLFSNQKGACAICSVHQTKLRRPLDVDHDHVTGLVRGLLCSNCNTGLGLFKDNIITLSNVIRYLQNQARKNNSLEFGNMILN